MKRWFRGRGGREFSVRREKANEAAGGGDRGEESGGGRRRTRCAFEGRSVGQTREKDIERERQKGQG